MGRQPIIEDQVQDLCEKCGINVQTPGPKTKLGYKRFLPFCSSCTKKKYNLKKKHLKYREHKKDVCNRCGFIPEHPCQLDVHHIDLNHFNNNIDNLETVCANCHRLIHAKGAT